MAAPSPGPPPTSAATSAGGSPSMVEAPPAAPTCAWTRQQEKLFENALAVHDQDAPDRWEKIAAMVTGKDAAAIKRHYDLLVEDVNSIEAGRVPLPPYSSAAVSATECMGEPAVGSGESSSAKKSGGFSVGHSPVVAVTSNGSGGNSGPGKGTPKSSDQERRKGIPWTEDEHRQSSSKPSTTALLKGCPISMRRACIFQAGLSDDVFRLFGWRQSTFTGMFLQSRLAGDV